ncbi:MAG: DUF6509 family protein [Paenibacillus dendritiformis]|uniref:DUF6509 family protein n=1 Tax=Paenibacillus dendritiformis TaxID=130049 RepID=UPI00143D4F5B|nr:DUF6509 family protein [Paenibacillus dendritiformis]MDU5145486.1 DUF6509 family protein [Paenibacillus dendritiformis]NKI20438.1 pullulanase [Paenibacillus dendritiformis]NRG01536.1 pullulanase [Paenibacillus dendritiformis]
MLTITDYSVESVKDPFRILAGRRYEFRLDIEVPEDDELYSEHGVYVRVIYAVEAERSYIVKHEIYERTTDRYLELDLEDDEIAAVNLFCSDHYAEADEP